MSLGKRTALQWSSDDDDGFEFLPLTKQPRLNGASSIHSSELSRSNSPSTPKTSGAASSVSGTGTSSQPSAVPSPSVTVPPLGLTPKISDAISSSSGTGTSSNSPSSTSKPSGASQSPAVSRPSVTVPPVRYYEVLDIDEDGLEIVGATQVEDSPREFYGIIKSKAVGCRWYKGLVSKGETVICTREPTNKYDKNAIRVDNVNGDQVGHIPKALAARLAPWIDSGEIKIEGKLTEDKGEYDVALNLSLYGTSDVIMRPDLERRLVAARLLNPVILKKMKKENRPKSKLGFKSGRSSAGSGGSQTPIELDSDEPGTSMADILRASQAVVFRITEDMVKTLAMDEEQLSKMPKAVQPEALHAQLLPYQLQGLAWLTQKENPEFPPPGSPSAVQLWKRDPQGRYLNIATSFKTGTAPHLLKGGILADDMGLGKTLQVISLILTGGQGQTLIVAPMTVMSNWVQQIERHVRKENMPEILVYHGAQRPGSVGDLANYRIVITSYGTMTSESKGKQIETSPLFTNKWRRVVLDEGHIIRNARTRFAMAACALNAESRWVLSGTPIVNSVKDLHSMLKFLRITGGIEQAEVFHREIGRGISRGDKRSEALLQSVMQDLCLRRHKEMKFVDLKLPPKTEYVHRISFLPDEQKKYNVLLDEARGALEEFQRRSKLGQGARFQSVLERLLRLRQTCCHWTLCRKRIDDILKMLEDQGVVELTDKMRALLQAALRLHIESQEDCCVCLDSLKDPVITHCKHVFCRNCITAVIETQHKCPMCRAELAESKLLEPAPETSDGGNIVDDADGDVDEENDSAKSTKSSKTEALLNIVQATLKDPGSKIIIFSQWTSFLSVIQRQLDEAGHVYVRVDGSMKTEARDEAIRSLECDANTRIMLASLGVCSVGLNLVAADTVILADSWWAPAIEDQAVDRVHRLGQTRPTTVWRLVMEDSIEERVLEIQAKKRELVSKAFQEKSQKKKVKETRVADIARLLR